MSISDYLGNVLDVDRVLKLRVEVKEVLHVMVEHRVYLDGDKPSQGHVDNWETLCETWSWDEKRPKLTRRQTTCLMCLGLDES